MPHPSPGRCGEARRSERVPFWHDHFVCAGSVEPHLAPGQCAYQIDRGPEYFLATGMVAVAESGPQAVTNRLRRLVNLAKEGWWSGDLHVHRSPADMELLMQEILQPHRQAELFWQGKVAQANAE
jgi:hypothetical protein